MDAPIKITPIFGRIELQSRMRPEGNRIVGEGRALHYDQHGMLTKDTGWEPTGCSLEWVMPKPSWLQQLVAKVRVKCHGTRT